MTQPPNRTRRWRNILINYDWNWSAAEKEFKRSIELKPDYATAHEWYAIHYLTEYG